MRRIISLKKKPLNSKRDYRPRRVWTLSQKLQILEYAANESMRSAARKYDVDVRLIAQWRRDQREGVLAKRTWGQPGKRKKPLPDEMAQDAEVMDEDS